MKINLISNYSRLFLLYTYLLFFSIMTISAQEVAISPNHLVHKFIERHITLGNISQSEATVRPLTYTKVRALLSKLYAQQNELSNADRKLLSRFSSEFSVDKFDESITFPWQKTALKELGNNLFGNYQLQANEPHLLSYGDKTLYTWMDFSETARLESIDEEIYRRYTEKVSILGSISDKISYYVNFSMNRFVGDSSLVYQIADFKNEDHPYFDKVNWTFWYQSEAAFNLSTKYGNFQFGKTPVIWGYSPENSPILSGYTQTFPFINYSYKYKNIGFHYLHGSLLPKESNAIHRDKKAAQKYIAAQRVELQMGNNFTMSFNEMVIYGNRSYELEYLIPVNFYWAAEHNQGDRDNLLMALDCSWRIKPGFKWYNTLFWDELAWDKIFTKWWANKFVYQTGLHWTAKSNQYLPDLRIEATISRPWTYTHNVDVNSYTSAGLTLGLPQGPNAQSLLIKVGLWPSYRWHLTFSSMLMRKGSGLGSSPTDNYDLRNEDLDDNTPYLLGDIDETLDISVESNYSINRMLNLFGKISYENSNSDINGHLGLTFDW